MHFENAQHVEESFRSSEVADEKRSGKCGARSGDPTRVADKTAIGAGELSDEIDVPLTASALFGMVLVAALDWRAFQPERSLEEVHAALSRLLPGRVGGAATRR